ncbi:peptidylprolyl isomerase [Zeaxanthinibacter enoshimensis]|uniref:peptidylprolyl isomerase n=1 Tax=Zeaxanthinibacter enoshimensis TaxID=392009 RepID=A0A4R6TG42_9FLAO|nr:peptidylprolyl isomerase [Zeaxanthinibacter enoshimensis]TDQ29325.1 cyclophilin family peptidyl-prolyl cis-trans isomerase [Zeaxanthinibacter enoshimensis]
MKNAIYFLLLFTAILTSCKSSQHADLGDGIFADIETSEGDIIIRLEYQKTPVTVANFITLAEGTSPFVSDEYKDKKYYDGVTFHRVIKDFMIQGGDPTGSGNGNPGYKFKNEIHDSLSHNKAGILSMANAGPGTNGSQFFITHKETPWLDGRHTVFGEVVSGMSVVDTIAQVKTGEKDKPVKDVVMNKVEIIRNGKAAKNFDAVQVMSDYFAEEEAKVAAAQKVKSEFIATIAEQRAKADSLPSGLKILRLEEGTGEKPAIGNQVMVDYAGWLTDGTLFDTSEAEIAEKFGQYDNLYKMHRGNFSPVPMDYSPDSRLVAGFKEGLLSMNIGDKVRLFIPPHLGYGAQGGGPIPPNAELVFDVEIVEAAK